MPDHNYEEVISPNKYFDRNFNIEAVKILPGEYFVTGRNMVLVTVLGSCVAACVRDKLTGIAGMNHFMLPDNNDGGGPVGLAGRYGTYAMELMINQLLKSGARRANLEAKVFGGGAVLANMTMLNIGDRNADFVLRYLEMEQVRVTAQDLRGNLPRRVSYFPDSGKVMVRKLRRHDEVVLVQKEEQELVQALARAPGYRVMEKYKGSM